MQIDILRRISVSTWENQKTEEKEQSPIGDGYPIMRSKTGAIHNMSTILVGTPYSPEKTIFPVDLGEFFNDSGIAGVQNTRA